MDEVQEFRIDVPPVPVNQPDDRQECRDFKRNVCKKGGSCKYYHPPRSVGDVLQRNSVCHDFQNKRGCNRLTCRYLHLTKEEEDYIKETGTAPPTIGEEEMAKLEGLPPLCNDYLQGRCSRGLKCKFRHVGEPGPNREAPSSRSSRDGPLRGDPYSRYDDQEYGRERQELRRRYREDMMEDEIMYLRAQVSRLKRQVADLTATNEMLMDENARLHVNRHPRPLSPTAAAAAAAKLESVLSGVGGTVPYSSSRVITAEMRTVAPTQPIAQGYGDSTRPTASGLVYGAAIPHH